MPSHTPTPTIHDAVNRRLVRLPDGTVARLLNITRRSRVATVLSGGRHLKFPHTVLVLAPDAEPVVKPAAL